MTFEKFESTGSGRGGSTEPKISIRKSGSLGINNAALEEFFSEDTEAVVMYFDEDENRVGMEQVEDKDEDDAAYTLTRSDSGGSVTPTAFLRRNQLIPERTEQYKPSTHKVNQNLELITVNVGDDSEDFLGYYGSPDDEEAAEADD